ncbi:hypothetical protein PF011_g27856 [Phytophthora fragariae]|uniref:Uncharacterized protein n=1 Tax=Phytophthora fragariae TaxID=53985 RepID=A0A6A3HCI3_9STRA|nr:hypothetical protein PF011_g27856 [Phytophthora fragariae]
MGAAPTPPSLHACRPDVVQPHSQIWRVGDKPNVTSCSRRPSPASSGGSGSSTASPPPPASSMGTTASSKLGMAQAQPS